MSEVIKEVLATQKIEGVILDQQTVDLMRLADDGHVSIEDAVKVVMMAACPSGVMNKED